MQSHPPSTISAPIQPAEGIRLHPLCRITATFVISLSAAGCSLLFGGREQLHPMDSVEMFLSRASLSDAEFEHVKLSPDTLFAECGKLRRGRYFPTEQDVTNPLPNERTRVRRETSRFIDILGEREWKWAPPGTNKDLTDPGRLELTIRSKGHTIEVKTTLDSISDPRSRAEHALGRVIRTIRGAAGGKLCGNTRFYGLGILS